MMKNNFSLWIDLMEFKKIFDDTSKMFNNYSLQFYAQEIGGEKIGDMNWTALKCLLSKIHWKSMKNSLKQLISIWRGQRPSIKFMAYR
jgi:hypothetical protein